MYTRPETRHRRGTRPTSAQEPIRVVFAEDSYLLRESILMLLESAPEVTVAAACSDGNELEAAIAAERPDVVITDIRMPPSGAREGIQIAARLRETDPEIGVVVLSQYAEPGYALELLDQGSGRRAYLLKESIRDQEELIRAIQAVARGGSAIDPKIVDLLIEARTRTRAARSPLAELTPRQRELLAAIAEGLSNAAIAERFVLTKRAVEKHVNAIFANLGLPETPDVARRVKAALIYLAEEGG